MIRQIQALCILLLTSFLCAVYSSGATLPPHTVTPMYSTNKLPVNDIVCIFQDKDGFMWYGTADGLCRDDGYDIKVFRSDFTSHNPQNPHNEMASNYVNVIAEDDEGNIWFSTEKGVYILHKADFSIRLLRVDDFPERTYTLIHKTSDGKMLLGGTSALYVLDSKGTVVSKKKLSGDVALFYEDSKGDVFMSVYGEGLYRCSAGVHKWQLLTKECVPTAMTEDNEGSGYWICHNGVARLLISDDQCKISTHITPLPTPKENMDGREITFFTNIVQDDKHHLLWLQSYYSGLVVLNTDGVQIPLPEDVAKANGNTMNCLHKDTEGNIWVSCVGTGCHIVSWVGEYLNEVMMQEGNMFMSFVKDKGGVMWLDKDRNGLCNYSPASGKESVYADYQSVKTYPLYLIRSLSPTQYDGMGVWVAYYGNRVLKMIREERGSDAAESLQMTVAVDLGEVSPSGSRGVITCMKEDKHGNLYIGMEDGLLFWNRTTRKVETTAIDEGDISAIEIDGKNNIWCGSQSRGLLLLSHELTVVDSTISVVALGIDSKENVWMASAKAQILVYDQQTGQISDHSSSFGLNGDAINDIVIDNDDNILALANQRVYIFNPARKALKMLSTYDNDIRLSRINPHSVFFDKDENRIYIGGFPGIVGLNVKGLVTDPEQSSVYITNVTNANRSLWFAPERRTPEGVLELKADERNIEISFSSLDFLHESSVRYAYRMLPLNDEWIYLSGGRNSAVFSNLPKGEYTFQVKTMREDGLWDEECTSLTIYRQPAWYETTLAYFLYALLLIALVGYIAYLYRQRLRQQNEKALSEELTQTKLRYFTNISHELLTPLAVISSVVDSIDPLNDSQRDKTRLIRSNIDRLRHLLQQVIEFRKIEHQSVRLYVEMGNLTEFIEDKCVNSFIPLANNKHISLSIQKPLNAVTGYFDSDKIEKILFNLVSNAIKYTSEGKRVIIQLEETDQQAKISVTDEGRGIENRELGRIFNRFYSSRHNDNTQSNGIGLSLSKELIEIHHGTIRVVSQPHKGSTFTITFPLSRNAYNQMEIKDRQQEEQKDILLQEINRMAVEGQKPATDLSVLIVEDDVDMLFALNEILSKQYTTFTAFNGEEALRILNDNTKISFVVSDISMPKKDGISLCKVIKGNIQTIHISVILLTAMISSEKQIDSYQAGADAYLPKPFESKVLMALIANITERMNRHQSEFRTNPTILDARILEISDIDTQFVDKAIEIISQNLNNPQFDVEYLAKELCMSRSTFTRKIKAITGDTPLEFITSIKMKHAYQRLQLHRYSITEVYESIGYSNHHTFVKNFKDTFGILPSKV